MFKQYIAQVMLNAKTMANALLKKGYTLVSGTEGAEDEDAPHSFILFAQNTYNKFVCELNLESEVILAFLPLKVCDAVAFGSPLYSLQPDLHSGLTLEKFTES